MVNVISINPNPSGWSGNQFDALWSGPNLAYHAGHLPNTAGFLAAADGEDYAYHARTRHNTFQNVATVVGDTYELCGLLANPEDPDIPGLINNPNGAIAAVYVDGQAVVTVGEYEWEEFCYTFTATSTSTEISFGLLQEDSGGPSADTSYLIIDNLSLTAVVPEPSTALFSAAGLMACAFRRKRSK